MVKHVRDGLKISVNCTMSQPITTVISPSHPVMFAVY